MENLGGCSQMLPHHPMAGAPVAQLVSPYLPQLPPPQLRAGLRVGDTPPHLRVRDTPPHLPQMRVGPPHLPQLRVGHNPPHLLHPWLLRMRLSSSSCGSVALAGSAQRTAASHGSTQSPARLPLRSAKTC